MDLNLTVISYNQQSPQQPMSHTWHCSSGSFGRADSNQWVLPDPQSFVSGQHGVIFYENNEYYLCDVSTNGIFLNHSLKKLPKYEKVLLKTGDHLGLGLYELIVKLVPYTPFPEDEEQSDSQKNQGEAVKIPIDWPESEVLPNQKTSSFPEDEAQSDNQKNQGEAVKIPIDWPESEVLPNQKTSSFPEDEAQSDNQKNQGEAVKIPIDWPESEVLPNQKTSSFPEDEEQSDNQKNQGETVKIPIDWPESEVLPDQKTSSFPEDEEQSDSQKNQEEAVKAPIDCPRSELPEQLLPPKPSLEPQARLISNYESFFKGCGVKFTEDRPYILPNMEHLGRLMRIAIQGTFDLLNSRNELKGAFHMEQSIIQRKGNNPLKFSINADEALNRLFLNHADTDLLAEEALTEAFEDIRMHQLAVLAGMHSALKQVLARFEPAKLVERLEKDHPLSASIPYQREHKLWGRFEELYAQIEEECTDDFQRLFGLEFVQAYQAQIIQLKKERLMETGSVIWQEGLFLRPQLFQQQERFFLNWFEQRCNFLRPYNWGFTEINIDTASLRLGKLALLASKGVFPDGTPFDAPNKSPLPPPLNIPAEMKDCQIYLGLPLQQEGVSPVVSQQDVNPLARFVIEDKKIQDLCTPGLSEVAEIQLGVLRLSLLTQYDNTQAFALIPLCKVIDKTPENLVRLDESFIPTVLCTQASQLLQSFVRMICGLLKQRGDKLAQSLVSPSGAGAAEVSKFLQLQLINRHELLFAHLERMSQLHPEELYRLILMLAGEFATFTRSEKRTVDLGAYYHHDLALSFQPLIVEMERAFNTTEVDKAVSLDITEQKFGIWVGSIPDKSLIGGAAFILAAKAQLPPEKVRQAFPKQTTISTANKIASLVNSQLPGIALDPMPVAPPQIPFHVGFSYFSINTQDPTWSLLATGDRLAVHIGTKLPGLELELWAIRN